MKKLKEIREILSYGFKRYDVKAGYLATVGLETYAGICYYLGDPSSSELAKLGGVLGIITFLYQAGMSLKKSSND